MADNNDLSSPLLQSPPSDHPHLIIDVPDDDDDGHHHHHRPKPNHRQGPSNQINHGNHNCHRDEDNDAQLGSRNPYAFLGSDFLEVPRQPTVNPFRNHTAEIEGVYEWVKILILLPVVIVRLVLFGVCLAVGYLATRLALEGWTDKQNPMPKWRCRIMWITRFSARCILFSFG